ncbi:MAG: hypothetical protein ACRCUY_09930 [Thermoguttaceae bacterium]
MMKKLLFIACFLIAACFLGCGAPSSKVTGTISFDDGEPIDIGAVFYDNGAISGRGFIVNGKYDMGLFSDGEGIPHGDYKIYIQGPMLDQGGNSIPMIAVEYTDLSTTPLTFTVKSGRHTNDIRVPRNPRLPKSKK